MAQNDYALVIGLNHYEDSSLSNLNGAIQDAQAMRTWFTDPDKGNIPEANCLMVTSTENPIAPRKYTIDDALENIYVNAQANGGGRFYFYFSGHGFSHTMRDNTLVISDWRNPIRFNNALNSKKYLEVIQESGVFREIFFFLDCCRNRKIKCEGQGPQLGFPRPDQDQTPAQNVMGFAAEYNNSAYEAEQNIGEDEIVQGHFTKALLEGLNGAKDAKNENGEVTLEGLRTYAVQRTIDIALESSHSQKPRFVVDFDDDPVLVTYPVHETDQMMQLIITSEIDNVEITIENSALDVIEQRTLNGQEFVIDVPVDIYSITNLATDKRIDIYNQIGKKEYHVTI